jgi:plastocyanin
MSKRSIVVAAILLTLGLVVGCSSENQSVPAAAAYDPATATTRVSGSIKFEGSPPEPVPIHAGGSAYCVRNARGLVDEEVSLTSDKKLRNVIIYVKSGQEGRTYETPSEAVVLDQQKCAYVPHVLTVMTNQKLSVRNSDPTFHNVHGASQANPGFNFAQTDKGAENTLTFPKAEAPFHIGCDLHRWMGAFVGVFDHPFHTTSGMSGDYELRLPPGKYEIVAWHEKFGEKTLPVEVAENAKMELNFTFAGSEVK